MKNMSHCKMPSFKKFKLKNVRVKTNINKISGKPFLNETFTYSQTNGPSIGIFYFTSSNWLFYFGNSDKSAVLLSTAAKRASKSSIFNSASDLVTID